MAEFLALAHTAVNESALATGVGSLTWPRHRDMEPAEWCSPDAMVRLYQSPSGPGQNGGPRTPIHNEDRTIWLVGAGEIENHRALRKALERCGHRFSTAIPAEAAVHAYEAWGDEAPAHLEGTFVFVLWDGIRRRLLAARDRLGFGGMYLVQSQGGIALSSRPSPLLPTLPHRAEPDPIAAAYVLTMGYVPAPLCIWRGVRRLGPGCLATWDSDSGLRDNSYWEPPRALDDSPPVGDEWVALFETVLSDQPVDERCAVLLSAGLDSTALAAALRRIGRTPEAITLRLDDPSVADESRIAAETARHAGMAHQCITLEPPDPAALMDSSIRYFDEPQAHAAVLACSAIFGGIAQQVDGVITGDGAEEVFGGYAWYPGSPSNGQRRRQPARKLRKLAASVAAKLRLVDGGPLTHHGNGSDAQGPLLMAHAARMSSMLVPGEVERLLEPTGIRFGMAELVAPLEPHWEPALPVRRAVQRLDLMTFCADAVLTKVLRNARAHGCFVRMPFLDRRIVEAELARPVDPREARARKPVLRDYLASRVPSAVLARPKAGFDLHSRMLRDFDETQTLATIRQSPWVRDGYWTSDWEALATTRAPRRRHRIWALWALATWAATRPELT